MSNTLVLGVGNITHADAGAGVYAMRYLRDHYDLPDTTYLNVGTLSATLAADMAAADNLIVFSATEFDADPGAVRVFQDEEVDDLLKSEGCSLHNIDLTDLLDNARLEGKLPARYALIGIQPGKLGPGNALSETVRRSIPRAAGNAATLVHRSRRPIPGKVVHKTNVSP